MLVLVDVSAFACLKVSLESIYLPFPNTDLYAMNYTRLWRFAANHDDGKPEREEGRKQQLRFG